MKGGSRDGWWTEASWLRDEFESEIRTETMKIPVVNTLLAHTLILQRKLGY